MSSATVVPTDFLRLKYRAAPHVPRMDDMVEGQSHSLARKVKPPEEDLSEEMKNLRFKPPIMLPAHTQNTRVEKQIFSDDVTYRREHKPTLFERVEIQKGIMKIKLREEKQEAAVMAQKQEAREALAKQAAESAGVVDDDNDNDEDNKKKGGDNEEKKDEGDAQHAAQLKMESDTRFMDEVELAEYHRMKLEQKEKKLLRTRNSHTYHIFTENMRWMRRRLAVTLFMNIGFRSKDVTEIMPWLLLGPGSFAQQQHKLMEMGVTHILNVTEELDNPFPDYFVYMRVPIRDSEHESLVERFESVLNFFERVENKRGKLFVHCTNGCGRAPAFIIAYLVANRKISLADAYTYVRARRPITQLNSHFLFQLAQLELAQEPSNGCSVLFHKDWHFYEFNTIKADIDKSDWWPAEGVFSTTLKLYNKRDDESDHF